MNTDGPSIIAMLTGIESGQTANHGMGSTSIQSENNIRKIIR